MSIFKADLYDCSQGKVAQAEVWCEAPENMNHFLFHMIKCCSEGVEFVTNLTWEDPGVIRLKEEGEGRAESCRYIIDFDIRRSEYITLVNIAVSNKFASEIIQT